MQPNSEESVPAKVSQIGSMPLRPELAPQASSTFTLVLPKDNPGNESEASGEPSILRSRSSILATASGSGSIFNNCSSVTVCNGAPSSSGIVLKTSLHPPTLNSGIADRGNEPKGNEPNGKDPSGKEPSGNEPKGNEPNGEVRRSKEPSGKDPNGKDPSGADAGELNPSPVSFSIGMSMIGTFTTPG